MSKEEQWELSVSLVMVSALSARASALAWPPVALRRAWLVSPRFRAVSSTVFILGSAFVEALALIGFVVSLIVK